MAVPKVVSVSEPINEVTKITQPIGTKNVAGTQVNPATEETLAKLMPTTPTKYAVVMTNADTEYSQALPANTKKFRIHLRDLTAFRLAYITGNVATPIDPYETIPANQEKYEDGLFLVSTTLYFASAGAGKTAEIEAWS